MYKSTGPNPKKAHKKGAPLAYIPKEVQQWNKSQERETYIQNYLSGGGIPKK